MTTAMKERELRAVAKCHICDKGFGHTGLPLFWRVQVTRYGVDADAVRRQDGLTAMLGGHAALAQIMGTDDDMAKPIGDSTTITVCESCATDKSVPVALLVPEEK